MVKHRGLVFHHSQGQNRPGVIVLRRFEHTKIGYWPVWVFFVFWRCVCVWSKMNFGKMIQFFKRRCCKDALMEEIICHKNRGIKKNPSLDSCCWDYGDSLAFGFPCVLYQDFDQTISRSRSDPCKGMTANEKWWPGSGSHGVILPFPESSRHSTWNMVTKGDDLASFCGKRCIFRNCYCQGR